MLLFAGFLFAAVVLCLCLFFCREGHGHNEFDREVRLHLQAAGRGRVAEGGFQRGAGVDFHRYNRVSQLGFK